MAFYRVTWMVELDADSEHDAAREAFSMQQDEASTATVFGVVELDEDDAGQLTEIGPVVYIDVMEGA